MISEIRKYRKYWKDRREKHWKARQEKYRNYLEDILQELKQEKPQQEPQKLRKEADLAAGGAAQADLAAGGAAQATLQKGAWTPADPPEAGFAGQGQNTQ